MAIVKNPLQSEEASGSVGGVTHARWRGNKVVRIRPIPTQPRTSRQSAVRNIIATLSRAWAALTDAQRTAWRNYADQHPTTNRLGQQVTPTGFNQYVGLNFFLLDNADSAIDSPPSVPPSASIATLTLIGAPSSGVGGEVGVTTSGTPSASAYVDYQLAGPFQSPGRRAQESDYRHKEYTAGNSVGTEFTDLVEDSYYWVRARYVDQYGQETPFLTLQFQADPAP